MTHITFIHGISNKPTEEKLLRIWLDALAQEGDSEGLDLSTQGITSSMVYWADVMYETPIEQSAAELAYESLESYEYSGDTMYESNVAVAMQEASDPDMSWREHISGNEKQLVDSLGAKLSFDMLVNDEFTPPKSEIDKNLERIPLPWFIKRRLMKLLLRDVHHYLFNYKFSPRQGTTYPVQEEIRNRMIKKLKEGAQKPGPHIVVSHSMGTVIVYDCLMRVPDCPPIDGLMTIGSPLGIDEVQDQLKPEWTRENGFPDKLKGSWVNVYDMLDPVTGFDGNIANDFKHEGKEIVEVINEQNSGTWRHSITKYFGRPKLRAALAKQLDLLT